MNFAVDGARELKREDEIERAVDRVFAGSHSHSDLGNLITWLYQAKSLIPLERLLNDPRGNAAADGLYILSELGVAAAPLTRRAADFLQHESEAARYFAISCIFSSPEAAGQEALAGVFIRLEDSSKRVRWKAIEFASEIDEQWIELALEHFRDLRNELHISGTSLLLTASVNSVPAMLDTLESASDEQRAYVIAAAVRLINAGKRVTAVGSRSGDEAVSEFSRHFC